MKKALSLVFALVLVFALAVPAFAAEVTTAGATDATVSYAITGGYTVTIPETLTAVSSTTELSAEGADNLTFTGKLAAKQTLTVSVAPAGQDSAYELVNSADDTKKMAYGIYADGTSVASGAAALTVVAGTASAGVVVAAKLSVADLDVTGTYTDSITFTLAVATAE